MIRTKKIFFTTLAILTVYLSHATGLSLVDKPSKEGLTFFYAPKRLEAAKLLPLPDREISLKELYKLNDQTAYLLDQTPLSLMEQTILPAYIANAQKDFCFLSYLLTGSAKGDLGPVTLWTLQLFIPDAALPAVQPGSFDVYSCYLASLVIERVAERLKEERSQIAAYPVKNGQGLFTPTSKDGFEGLEYGSAKTWFINSSNAILANAPLENETFWKKQWEEIYREQEGLNGEKMQAVFEWAGLTHRNAGRWEPILDAYLKENNIPLIQQTAVRALLLSALADANAVVFNTKYTYWVMRPSQRDKNVIPLIVIPSHPSYPSAHSAIAGAAAGILTELFPQDKERWQHLAHTSGMSRIWGGIHYPIDHEAGLNIGKKVAKAALSRQKAPRNVILSELQ